MSVPLGTLVFHIETHVKVADVGPGPWWEQDQARPLDELSARQVRELVRASLHELAQRVSPDQRERMVGAVVALVEALDSATPSAS